MNVIGHFQFVSETTSNSMPGGDDPRRPPTPSPRPTPQPRLSLKRKKDPKKNTQYFLTDPRLQQHDEEIEIVLLDDNENEDGEVVIIPDLTYNYDNIARAVEVPVPASPGSVAVITSTRTCPSTSATASTSSAPIEYFHLAPSDSESSNGPDEVQFTTRLPPLRPYPSTDRIPTASNQPLLPHWRGLIWGRPGTGVTNTCVMDPFFSHILYTSRRYPRYFRTHLNLADSRPESYILFLSQNTQNRRQSITEMSHSIHKSWIRTLSPNYYPTDSKGDVDMASNQHTAITAHLLDSQRIWFVYQCGCDATTRTEIDNEQTEWKPEQVQALNNPSLGAVSMRKSGKKCKECKNNFQYTRGLVSQATWFHIFQAHRVISSRDNYPLSIQFQEIGTNAIVHFDLAFFSYRTRQERGISHHVTLHRIEGEGLYFYDCILGSGLLPIPSDLEQRYAINAVVYFRRHDETRPK
jgi:hypothetical protein